ncbi:MAG: hypothetical protein PHD21_01535 [Flavobacteriales bacterium]|nr:hypothetical protein [Flavobacteriales bacterium]
MKALFSITILLIGMMSYGQNHTVKGVVINSDATPVANAQISAQKTKTKATTNKNGLYEISVSPKEKELSLYINEVKVMSMPVSKEIAEKPVAFQMDSNTDPVKVGYIKGDTYYPCSEALTVEDIIKK